MVLIVGPGGAQAAGGEPHGACDEKAGAVLARGAQARAAQSGVKGVDGAWDVVVGRVARAIVARGTADGEPRGGRTVKAGARHAALLGRYVIRQQQQQQRNKERGLHGPHETAAHLNKGGRS